MNNLTKKMYYIKQLEKITREIDIIKTLRNKKECDNLKNLCINTLVEMKNDFKKELDLQN